MRACVQRVGRASVSVADRVVGEIGRGFVVLLGVAQDDDETDTRFLAHKVVDLRVFEDDAGKMNRSLADVGGAMLVISQFTLLGDCRKGRRPSFVQAAPPEMAEKFYETFVEFVRARGIEVATGVFREMMQVSLVNEGPVTMLLDSKKLF